MHSSSTPGRAKGARLIGGAATEEALNSSASVLDRRGARTRAGLQQFFSPPEAAALAFLMRLGPSPGIGPETKGDRPVSTGICASAPRRMIRSKAAYGAV